MSDAYTIPDYYTTREAATILGRDVSQICRYIRRGDLPAIDLGHQRLIRRTDVRRFRLPLRGNPNFRRLGG